MVNDASPCKLHAAAAADDDGLVGGAVLPAVTSSKGNCGWDGGSV